MSTNRPKRNIKPNTKFGDYVCSNKNVKSTSSSTVKAEIDKMDVNGGGITEDIDTNVPSECNESSLVELSEYNGGQEVRSGKDTETVNGKCSNEVKQGHSDEEKKDNESMGVNKGINADGNHTKAKVSTGYRGGKSYAGITINNLVEIDKNLVVVPTEMDCNGSEVVIFDEVMVAEGSKRWEGYFMGYSMSVNELRYNLRRMWSRHGFKEIIDFNNWIYFIKFHSDEGLNHVVDNGPWMVSNKPIIVQKWDINMCLDKIEPATVPLWIRMSNVPLEAWTTKGISALASRVGKPMVMDQITGTLCKEGMGRFRFARVLVEVSASKPLPNEIEVVYKNGLNEEICREIVKVVYDWKPSMCNKCCVFGHTSVRCGKKHGEEAAKTVGKDANMESNKDEGTKQRDLNTDNEGFIVVQKKKGKITNEKVLKPNYKPNTQQPKGGSGKQWVMSGKPNSQFAYQPKKNEGVARNLPPDKTNQYGEVKNKSPEGKKEKSPSKKAWSVHGENLSAMKRSANKYSVLELYDENEISELNDIKNREIVEEFINQKRVPTECDMLFWNIDMVAYYKQRKEQESCKGKSSKDEKGRINEEEIDVFNDDSSMAERLNVNEMMGMDRGILSDCWTVNNNRRVFYTIVYAANGAGCSHMTSDMSEFRDCVNNIEMEDISSSAIFYTWTKNLFKVKAGATSGVVKKLDRIIGNEEFIDKFSQADAIFLPYLISDHCPNVLVFPNSLQAKKKAFKFANFVANKEDFIPIVKKY
ncbi:zinc knuckle CX2CX4HX4C containing protein [Tanacetum coccineum]|uniref:Zinc knuckle CX2CX4HX4C containing protein n=1 Tax=Tanacetum coccineum TaxID=301880 RepID=A0ABQ5GLN8_9ASTR